MNGEFRIEYVELPNGRIPARELTDSLDDKAAARIDAFIDRLKVYGNRMQGKFVKKLAFQKKSEQTPPNEIVKAEKLRRVWLKYRNRYTGSKAETDTILRELGI
jgi:hypothetical protein